MVGKHLQYKDNISQRTYNVLNNLHQIILKADDCVINENTKQYVFKNYDINTLKKYDLKLKSAIFYQRYCILVEALLKEYADINDLDRKEIIDYYVWDNRLKELNCIGLSWYYNYKFKKSKATIYKGRFKKVNWDEIKNKELKDKTGIDAMQSIIKTCRKHINPGGEIQLRSFSKCFGIDLFKYVSLYKHIDKSLSADIYIKRDAEINIIKIPNKTISIQQFILNNICINESDFVLDFSMPRNDERENFEKWYKDFMCKSEKFYEKFENIQMIVKETEKYHEDFFNILVEGYENSKQISKMVSPLADREVIVSGDVWGDSIEFDEESIIYSNETICDYKDYDKCVHFNLSEEELYQLIYRYYQKYAQEKYKMGPKEFEDKYNNYFTEIINDLKKRSISKESTMKETTFFKLLDKLNTIKKECKKTSIKVESIISFIEWNNEEINLDWTYKNIFNKQKENAVVNFVKCIMFDIICKNERGINQ